MSESEYFPQEFNDQELKLLSAAAEYVDFKSDSNTKYIIEALTKWKNFNRDEIRFRISETSLIQVLGILVDLIKENLNHRIELSKENLELFFLLEKNPSMEDFEFNCINQYPNSTEEELFETVINFLIKVFKFEIQKTKNESLTYFENTVLGTLDSPSSNFERISIFKFLIKGLELKIEFLNKYSKILDSQIEKYNHEKDQNNSYSISTPIKTIEKLYKELSLADFINESKTSLVHFINVLTKSWDSHTSKIYLEMDHLQTKLLIDSIKEILNIKISYSDIEKAKNITNNNGYIKAPSLYSSASKSFSLPKKSELILNLIKKVKN